MKANHNKDEVIREEFAVVSNGSKILKWKQITTVVGFKELQFGLFLMVQRY